MSAIPIVLCGRNPPLAQAVRQNLMPEYDVIHIISSPTVGTSDLPLLLASPLTVPPNSQSNLGSQNYSKRPAAVVVGGGFDDQMFKQMKDACKETMDIPWGKADLSMSGEMPNYNNVDAFGKAVAQRVKTRLLEVDIGGRNGVENGEFRY